jgi:4-alpha-glucanotransferase
MIETLFASGADLVVLPIQDVFGWRGRINRPATVADTNWTWRLPWPVDRMLDEREAVEAASRLRQWTTRYGR